MRFQGIPAREHLEAYAWQALNSEQIIPGYGYAVLRVTDPRFTALLDFGQRFLPEDEFLQLVMRVCEVSLGGLGQ